MTRHCKTEARFPSLGWYIGLGVLLGTALMTLPAIAQEPQTAADASPSSKPQGAPQMVRPTKSREQEQIHPQTVPKDFETKIFVTDAEGARRAQQIIELYDVLQNDPTIENVRKYVSDGYIQHSAMLPDGPPPVAMLFSLSKAQYPVAIDIHKVAVVGDFAMAHVNFRNLDSSDPGDLGIAAVDMYYWGKDGKIAEHWDVLQEVPTFSANTNTMFLQLTPGGE